MFYVYIYKDPQTNQPFYVGKGSGDRAYYHLKETKDRTENYLKWCKIKSLQNANTPPTIEIVYESDDEISCYEEEARLILKYGRKNLDEGGILTNRCLDNRPPTYAGSLPRSEDYLKKLSESKKGKKNPMYGKKPWNEGVSHSEKTKRKIGKANVGRKRSKEEIEKRNSRRGKIYQLMSPDGKQYIVQNLKHFAKENGLCYENLREACLGYKGKTHHKGWIGKLLGNINEMKG